MAPVSPPRIDWAPRDAGFVTSLQGALRIHARDGAVAHELATENVFDARWVGDTIVAVDDQGTRIWNTDGVLLQRHVVTWQRPLMAAALAPEGTRYVAIAPSVDFTILGNGIWQFDIDGAREWTIETHEAGIPGTSGRWSIATSAEAARVAVGYQTPESNGRGFVVIDRKTNAVVDRSWAKQNVVHVPGAPHLFAFDAEGKRVAQGVPELGEAPGVIRGGRGERDQRRPIGGTLSIALDRGGTLAAYGYRQPLPGTRGRLRVDYLAPGVKGPPTVEVLDTQSLDPALPDLVALAFSPDSRSIACLASTGAIEVVPVP